MLCRSNSFLGRFGAGDASNGGVEARLAGVVEVRGLPLHLLGNDGGQRRARSCERSVVLRGATSSTRSWARSGVARGFGSGLLIRKPLRAVVRGFG